MTTCATGWTSLPSCLFVMSGRELDPTLATPNGNDLRTVCRSSPEAA